MDEKLLKEFEAISCERKKLDEKHNELAQIRYRAEAVMRKSCGTPKFAESVKAYKVALQNYKSYDKGEEYQSVKREYLRLEALLLASNDPLTDADGEPFIVGQSRIG